MRINLFGLIFLGTTLLLSPTLIECQAQVSQIQGYIIAVGENNVTLDLKEGQVSKGDLLKVVKPGEVIVHPVTGEKIQKKDEVISNITVTEVAESYSVGEAYPLESFGLLKVGMKVFTLGAAEVGESMIKKYVVIPPMTIVGAERGQLGSYMGDVLTEKLFNLDRFRILDRETFDIQQFELGLKKNGAESKTTGVDYLIVGSAYPPDVVEKATGIPLKAIATAATGGQGALITKNLVPDLKIKELEALVKFTLKIIDVSTGEVIFICSEMAKAEGKNQINLESGVLGGITLNGGATDFKNTVTGKASEIALTNAAKYIADYFEGKIKVKNFQGTVIELKKEKKRKDIGENLAVMDIRQGPDGIPFAVIGGGSDEGVVKSHSFLITLPKETVSEITGKRKVIGVNKVAKTKIKSVEFDAAIGDLNGVLLGQDIQNNIIYQGRLMHFTPFRLTTGASIYGVWSDALLHFDLGMEYFPNLANASWINNSLWVGIRAQFGTKAYYEQTKDLLFKNNFSTEFLIGVNPMRKSFDYEGFDPYFGIKYKYISSDLAGGGPDFFMGFGIGKLFAELDFGWGPHADMEAMSDPTFSKEIVGWGFNRLGANFGYRFPIPQL